MLRSTLAAGALLLAVPAAAAAAPPTPLPAGSTWLLSGDASLAAPLPSPNAGGQVGPESISDDGRYVVFRSGSDGLSDEDDDTRSVAHVYVKDRQTGAVTLVSRDAAGAPLAASSRDAVISGDGTRVAFTTTAKGVPGDANGVDDVYVRAWQQPGPTTVIASVTSTGTGGTLGSERPSLDGDGSHVAFQTRNAFSPAIDGADRNDIYLRDVVGGSTIVVSTTGGGAPAIGNGASTAASLSNDGTRVSFTTSSTNLGGAPAVSQVYVATAAGTPAQVTTLVSSPDGLPAPGTGGASGESAMSGDGSTVAFSSAATNLGEGDVGTQVYTRAGAETTLVSRGPGGVADGRSDAPAIDLDGSAVAFVSAGKNLDPADTSARPSAFLRSAGATTLLSRDTGDAGASTDTEDGVDVLALDGTGQRAAFTGEIRPFLADDDPEQFGSYLRDLAATPDTTEQLVRPAGSAPFRNSVASVSLSNGGASSADGRFAVYGAEAFPGATGDLGVVVRDLQTGSFSFPARADGPSGAIDRDAFGARISHDGRHVVWMTRTALVAADDDTSIDVYVRDLANGRTVLASRADGADGPNLAASVGDAVLDADGSRVAYTTGGQVYLRDLTTGATLLVSSRDGDPATAGNGSSREPALSGDGARVAFSSSATNLHADDGDAGEDVFVRDLTSSATILASRAAGGAKGDSGSSEPSISADGARVAFASDAENLGAASHTGRDVFLRDLSAGTTVLVSRATGENGAPADSLGQQPTLSADGTTVAWSTTAENLGWGDPGTETQLAVRDLVAATTVLGTPASGGGPSPDDARNASLSGDGACLVFTTNAHLVAAPLSADFNHAYLRAVKPGCVPAVPAPPVPTPTATPVPQPTVTAGPPAADRTKPVVTRAKLSRTRFRVGPKPTAVKAAARKPAKAGTTLTFRVSEPGKLTLRIERPVAGRKRGKTCVAVKRRPKTGRCTAYRLDGTITRTLRKAGSQKLVFSGRIGKKALRLGKHRMSITVTDKAGNRSAVKRVSFGVVRR